jgi:hypothetical protein
MRVLRQVQGLGLLLLLLMRPKEAGSFRYYTLPFDTCKKRSFLDTPA